MIKCGKCGGQMKIGKALQNTPVFGPPDSVHKEDQRGQTYKLTGPPKLITVFKCSKCGRTVSCR